MRVAFHSINVNTKNNDRTTLRTVMQISPSNCITKAEKRIISLTFVPFRFPTLFVACSEGAHSFSKSTK